MGFATALALGLGSFVLLPWLAHRLRRSPPREERFAPLRFVPEASGPSDVPREVNDRALFASRALVVVLLALLAAGPRLRETSLRFHEGEGDAAFVFVLDDSGSMRTREGASSRLEIAKRGLLRVLDDLEGGDRVALVLAGKPARVVRGFTPDLEAMRVAVQSVESGDRATDLEGAIEKAEGLIVSEPDAKPVLVIGTDGEGAGGDRTLATSLPLHRVDVPTERRDDCAVLGATGAVGAVRVRIACQTSTRRVLRWIVTERDVATREVDLPAGASEVLIEAEGAKAEGRVELAAGDGIREDDTAQVALAGARMRVAVLERTATLDDEARTPPMLLRAFEAVAPDAEVQRIVRLPTDGSLSGYDVLAIDDAMAWTADERSEVQRATDAGLSLWIAFGPASSDAPIGASFEPFVEGTIQWEAGPFRVLVDDAHETSVRGRARFVPAAALRVEPLLAFEDGVPLALHGSGDGPEISLNAVPADPRFGDVSLRAGFLGSVGSAVDRARRKRPHGELTAGDVLKVPRDATVVGPMGIVPILHEGTGAVVHVERVGSYRVSSSGHDQVRHVTLDEAEVVGAPATFNSRAEAVVAKPVLRDRSPLVVAVLLLALALEFALRFRLRTPRGSPS